MSSATMPESSNGLCLAFASVGEPLPKHSPDSDLHVDPATINERTFAVKRRGYDRDEVESYLASLAATLHDAQRREADMRSRMAKAVRRAEAAEKAERTPARTPAKESEAVLAEAKVTAEQRLEAARESAARMLDAARIEADELRREAAAGLAESNAAAEQRCSQIIAAATEDADEIRNRGRADAHGIKRDAYGRMEQVLAHSEALIREAEEMRAQVLEDMERRRRQARAQVERLRVGRDRLLRSYELVRRTLDETTSELRGSLKEAKVRGDTAGRAVTAERPATRDQLEDELRDAKLIGRIATSGPETSSHELLREIALARPLELAPLSERSGADSGNDDTDIVDEMSPPVLDLRDGPSTVEARSAQTRSKVAVGPKAPASAPMLHPSDPTADRSDHDPIAVMMQAVEAKHGKIAPEAAEQEAPLDPELAQLEDPNLNVVEPSDEIEHVEAVPVDGVAPAASSADLEAQRHALVAEASKQIEACLKDALSQEENAVIAGIKADPSGADLQHLVGDIDQQVNRYIGAINSVAVETYEAGAALIAAQAQQGHLPAGAVEELLAADMILPLRQSLEAMAGETHVDQVRAMYLQRTTDDAAFAASRLANLLCVAGLCDALPEEAPLPITTDPATSV